MYPIILIVYTALFAVTVTGTLSVGWLLAASIALSTYIVLSCIFGTMENTSETMDWIVIMDIIGSLYSLMVVFGFDITKIF